MLRRERRAALEGQLRASGLAYGTGAQDPAVELNPEAAPGERAFAHFVAGLVRLCASAAALSHARWFVSGPPAQVGVRARRAQLLAVLAAAGGDAEAAARLFSDPTAIPNPLEKLADRTAARLSRRYLAAGGPFAGLPLHNGLCAVEVRCCATIALAAFQHARISPGAVALTAKATLRWRSLLVDLLSPRCGWRRRRKGCRMRSPPGSRLRSSTTSTGSCRRSARRASWESSWRKPRPEERCRARRSRRCASS